jgi:signal transduction histidine kinase
MYGYLGIEQGPETVLSADEDTRVLSVLGDLLCTHVEQRMSEAALRRSRQRYRHFIDATSEAIFRVQFREPVDVRAPAEKQRQKMRRHGVIAECNAPMARLIGVGDPQSLVGRPFATLLSLVDARMVEDAIAADYLLHNREVVSFTDDRVRHFVINAVGVRHGSRLVGLWGSAVEVTDRVELERRMVTALERRQRQIGRDLHDRVGQNLLGTRMLAQNVARRLEEDGDPAAAQSIERIVRYVEEAIQHVSDLQRGVMPVQVERDGLAQALQELASRSDQHDGIQAAFHHDGRADVHAEEVKLQLYRIAQEAIRNALAHARPSRLTIALGERAAGVVLAVSDDGAGFDVETARRRHEAFGLHSMQYRARAIGADLEVRAHPGEGTTVRCTVPPERLSRKPTPGQHLPRGR